ncbi:MAG: hypothetical protein FOGNACKC_00839 [Anaerolineae bacterium]|nr:hypothetical protein [Anaerolineae bacterium]
MEILNFGIRLNGLYPDEIDWLKTELIKTADELAPEEFGSASEDGGMTGMAEGHFCSWAFVDDDLRLFAETYANISEVGEFVRRWLARWRPAESRSLTWGQIDGFGENDSYGGALRITAKGIAAIEAVPWLSNAPATIFNAKLTPGNGDGCGNMVTMLRHGALAGWRVIHCEYDPDAPAASPFNCFIIVEGCHSLANWPTRWRVNGGVLELGQAVNASLSIPMFNFGPMEETHV